MKEALLQYAWQHKLFYTHQLATVSGHQVEIIDPGQLNRDAGPDFFNAKVRIGDTMWAGNVEIHINSSDWISHQHETDQAYNNIILHVVVNCNSTIHRSNGEEIEQLILPCYPHLESQYDALLQQTAFVACATHLPEVPRILLSGWKSALLTERLEQKTDEIGVLLANTSNDWEEAFYITLARNFGTGINATPFELLAKSLPQKYLARHKDNLLQIEALLFGQSGLCNDVPADDYTDRLKSEYRFLQHKYGLQPIDPSLWKLLRLHPQNFPHVRIAQFAALTQRSSKLFSRIIQAKSLKEAENLFRCRPSDYWLSHYTFAKQSASRPKAIGQASIRLLLINTVVPFLFSYGRYQGNESMKERALSWLEQLPAEHNSIIQGWQQYNVAASSAFDSQALIQLKKRYCDPKKCLQCRIGHFILKQERD